MNEIEWAEQAFEKMNHLINANLAAKEWIAAVLRLRAYPKTVLPNLTLPCFPALSI